jgi:N-dimethylarginine dimethylaminohydrolase
MLCHKILVSDANHYATHDAINPYYTGEPVDTELAKMQHKNAIRAFQSAGIDVLQVPSPVSSQDGVFTANWAVVHEKKAIIARLPETRKPEEAYAKRVLSDFGYNTVTLPDNLRFSGQGDAIILGDYVLCGQNYRSDEEALKIVAEAFGLERVQLTTVPDLDENGVPVINKTTGWADSLFFDIDLALTVIDENTIAYCKEAFLPVSQDAIAALPFRKVTVSLDEARNAFACNLVSTGKTVIMSDAAPLFKKDLEALGFDTVTVNLSEFGKSGGYVRCISLTLE